MIQRIQTFHLMVVTLLMAFACLAPLASFVADGRECVMSAFSIHYREGGERLMATAMMGILYVLSTVLPFTVIFLYKRRMLQARLCVVEIVLLLGCMAYAAAYYHIMSQTIAEFGASAARFRLASTMPIVAIILVILAIRGIIRDEALVRSLERIR